MHQLANKLIQCLEQPGVADRLRPQLLRLGSGSSGNGSGGGGSSGSGSSSGGGGGSPVLSYEQLLSAAYLSRWQANLAMLPPPVDRLLPAGREAAIRENAAGGRRMAELLPDCPVGWFAHSSALAALGRLQEAWGCLERCKQVGAGGASVLGCGGIGGWGAVVMVAGRLLAAILACSMVTCPGGLC